MKTRHSIAFLSILILLSIPTVYSQIHFQDGQKITQKTSEAVFGIRCVVERKTPRGVVRDHYYGTGAMISHHLGLTNLTVIPPGASEIKLFFANGKVIPADIVKVYSKLEATIIKTRNKKKLPYLPLSDTSKLKIGACVYTLGNPFHAIEQDRLVAVSRGIVSGIYKLANNGDDQSVYKGHVIETTAALNPGSDGGPLVDADGNLVGVLSLAFQKERRMGTAIPIHAIHKMAKELQSFELKTPSFPIITPAQQVASNIHKIEHAVVAIKVTREKAKKQQPKRPMTRRQQQAWKKRQVMQRPEGLVTGLAIENGEYVLTSSFHVLPSIRGKKPKIEVYSREQKKYIAATVKAYHMPYDMVLLKLKTPVKSFAKLGVSKGLEVGSWVGISGRQQESEHITLTTGIVSSVKRTYNLTSVIQTQALMNYANSGGPVVDVFGQIVGISAFINPGSDWGINSGVAIFVASDILRKILPNMIKGISTRKPTIPFLGVGLWVDRDSLHGPLISTVTLGSAASKAGVRPGDILISLGGKPVGEWSDLVRLITSKAVGQEIEFEVLRHGKKVKLKAKLGVRPWY